ncbi:MAG: hypothetical protein P8Y44_13350, partial [Acidobacteriota bacterium]
RDSWHSEIAGYTTKSALGNPRIELEFPGQRGRFVGRLEPHGKVFGHWIQPPMVTKGMAVASPVTLTPIGTDIWVGEVRPLDDVFTFFLAASRRDDGTIDAFLRNPQRNQGIFINVDRIERHDDRVDLVGTFFRNSDEHVLLEGTIYPEEPRISIDIDGWGGSYDFRPIGEDTTSSFYARAKDPEPWVYHRPKQLQDGWAVGSLAEVGIAIEPIKRLIETEIDPPADDIQDLYLHAMLIARHGKLVLEEPPSKPDCRSPSPLPFTRLSTARTPQPRSSHASSR